jgi:hypothetical protein
MSRCNFQIQLFPAWKEEIATFNKTQQEVNGAIEKLGRYWLDGCGYGGMYDPEEDPRARWEHEKLGRPRKLSKAARPMYEPRTAIRVTWGEWGPEHITVPGNACGLDLDQGGIMNPRGGRCLQPHNIDSMCQQILLLVIFTWFADCLVSQYERRER